MKIRKLPLRWLPLVVVLVFASCQKDESPDDLYMDDLLAEILENKSQGQGLDFFRMPTDLSSIPQDPANPLTESKINLGRKLFHETALGTDPENVISIYTYSCASCHHADAGFQAGLPQGLGEGGIGFGHRGEARVHNPDCSEEELDVQPLRSPSALNAAFQKNMLWNGQFGATGENAGTDAYWTPGTPKETNSLGYEGVETQAIAGLKVHRMEVNQDFANDNPEYQPLFDQAFPEFAGEERVSNETAGLAIAAYERTLMADQSPWQKWLNGESTAMSREQKRGAVLFFGKAGCVSCHTGPALNSMEFHALGLNNLNEVPGVVRVDPGDSAHLGRGGFTGIAADNYKFKVPQLYNLQDSPFYGHGSSINSIRDMVEYKNKGQKENLFVPTSQLADEFEPLYLTVDEVDAVTEFIASALYDPNLGRYVPESLPSGNCFPNNDAESRADLGCE